MPPTPLPPFSAQLTCAPSRAVPLLALPATYGLAHPTVDYMGKVPVLDKALEHLHRDIVMASWGGCFNTRQPRRRGGAAGRSAAISAALPMPLTSFRGRGVAVLGRGG